MTLQHIIAIAMALSLAACGSTSAIRQDLALAKGTGRFAVGDVRNIGLNTEVQAPEHFLGAIKGHLKAELGRRNSMATEDQSGQRVNIEVVSYRMRSGFTRMAFGLLAGKDGVSSKVTVLDDGGKVIGVNEVNTYNIMAIGGEDDIARMHAEEIAKYLSGEKQK